MGLRLGGGPAGYRDTRAGAGRAGRAVRAVWQNELGGITFEVGAGTERCFVKWAPAASGIDLGAEAARLDWAVSFTRVPRLLGQGTDATGSWIVTAALPGRPAPPWPPSPGRPPARPDTAAAGVNCTLRVYSERGHALFGHDRRLGVRGGRTVMVSQASRLQNVRYDIRGPVLRRARQLEADGHHILKLNLGNPAAFGIGAPDAVLRDVVHNIGDAQGYSDARGIHPARLAVAQSYQRRGVPGVGPDDVFLGNGVSELIVMALQALLDTGDEVLIPSPDYPLWTGAVGLCGGRAVHYSCDEDAGWEPDLEHVAAQISPRTRALVIINPNNPTGAVYSRQTLLGLLDLARRHGLLVLADEIYDQILYEGAVHECAAALAPDLLVLTMCGLSKTYRLAGFRSGWLVVSGPRHDAAEYLEGLELLANMRLCPNVPAQYAIATALGGGGQGIAGLLQPGGRLREQRDHAWQKINEIPGVDCVKPLGALYLFPRLDPEVHKIADDEQMVIDLLEQQHLLLSHGTGFNLPSADHLRLVFLAAVDVLDDAIDRLGSFLQTYRQ